MPFSLLAGASWKSVWLIIRITTNWHVKMTRRHQHRRFIQISHAYCPQLMQLSTRARIGCLGAVNVRAFGCICLRNWPVWFAGFISGRRMSIDGWIYFQRQSMFVFYYSIRVQALPAIGMHSRYSLICMRGCGFTIR